MRTCKCPNCNATLTIEDESRDFAFCQYCGAKIMLDDYRSTQRIVDEAKIKQIEYEREIRLKELALQEKQNEQKQRSRKILIDLWLIASAIVVIIVLGLGFFNEMGITAAFGAAFFLGGPIIGGGGVFIFKTLPEKEYEQKEIANGGIRFPKSVFPYDEKPYTVVENAISSAGFTNVKSVNMHDLTFGLLQKPSMVDSITVNGEDITSGGKIYRSNVPIVITYHGK